MMGGRSIFGQRFFRAGQGRCRVYQYFQILLSQQLGFLFWGVRGINEILLVLLIVFFCYIYTCYVCQFIVFLFMFIQEFFLNFRMVKRMLLFFFIDEERGLERLSDLFGVIQQVSVWQNGGFRVFECLVFFLLFLSCVVLQRGSIIVQFGVC